MPQVVEYTKLVAPKQGTGYLLIAYLLLVLLPIGLKLLALSRVAAWPWWKVTFLLWGPWLLVVVLSIGGWLLHLFANRRGRG